MDYIYENSTCILLTLSRLKTMLFLSYKLVWLSASRTSFQGVDASFSQYSLFPHYGEGDGIRLQKVKSRFDVKSAHIVATLAVVLANMLLHNDTSILTCILILKDRKRIHLKSV
jgi:hypothetical protein